MNGEGPTQSTETNDQNSRTDGNTLEQSSVDRDAESKDASKQEAPTSGAFQSKDLFDALVRDRDSLRTEVVDLRRSLEEVQTKHRTDMGSLQEKLDDAENKKEHAETQFQKLLERVNTIKSQLGERLKEDAVCLGP